MSWYTSHYPGILAGLLSEDPLQRVGAQRFNSCTFSVYLLRHVPDSVSRCLMLFLWNIFGPFWEHH
jgi:hypothetical protein